MKTGRVLCTVILSLLFSAAAASAQSAFAPLDLWANAVKSGDTTALAQFYSIAPPALTKTPQGVTQEIGVEPHFWAALAASGLSNFQPKILAIEHPQAGAVGLVLRIEFNLRTDSGVQPFVVEGGQVWVQQASGWQILQTSRSGVEPSPHMRLPEPAKPNIDLYAPPQAARGEIRKALAQAAKDHKRVILVFGANWCYDCHVLDATFHSKDIAPLVNASYHVVHINVGDDGDKNLDLANHYGIPLKTPPRVPSLAVLDPDGKLVYAQQHGEFDDSAILGPADVTTFLKKWAPPRQD
jgi:Thioredoxin-like